MDIASFMMFKVHINMVICEQLITESFSISKKKKNFPHNKMFEMMEIQSRAVKDMNLKYTII